MHNLSLFRPFTFTALCLALVIAAPATFAVDSGLNWLADADHSSATILLAESGSSADKEKPRSGTVVIPANAEKDKSEKKCMTVCQRWGQECMYDNNRGRKCRRTCKEFGQECF